MARGRNALYWKIHQSLGQYRITDAGRERVEEFLAEWPSVREIYAYVEEAHHDAR